MVVEIGAGTAIHPVPLFGEDQGCPLIRINSREWHARRSDDVGLPMGGLEGLRGIADTMNS